MTGQVDQFDLHAPDQCPALHLAKHACCTAGCRRDVESILVKSAYDSIINDDARLVAGNAITHRADLLFFEPAGVDSFKKRGGIWPGDLDLAKGPQIDHADFLTDILRFFQDEILSTLSFDAIIFRPQPCARVEELRAGLFVPTVHRREPLWMKPAACQMTQRHGMVERSRRGRSRFVNGPAVEPRQYPRRVHVGQFALTRTHAHRRVPLEQFDVVIAFMMRVDKIGNVQVLVKLDEILFLLVRKDGIRVTGRRRPMHDSLRYGLSGVAQFDRRRQPSTLAIGKAVRQIEHPVNPPCRVNRLGQILGHQLFNVFGIGKSPARLVQGTRHRHPSDAHGDSVTVDSCRGVRVRLIVFIQWTDDRTLDRFLAGTRHRLINRMMFVHGDARAGRHIGQFRRLAIAPEVDDRDHLHAYLSQVERHTIGIAVSGQDHAAFERLDAVQMRQTLGRGTEHHARQIVVLKHGRLFITTARYEHRLGAKLRKPTLVDQCVPMIAITAGDLGGKPNLNVRVRHHFFDHRSQLSGRVRITRPLPGQTAAHARLFVDQQHTHAFIGRRSRASQTRRAGTDDQQIVECVVLRRGRRRHPRIDLAEARDLPHLVFVEREQPARRMECFVVEAYGHELRTQLSKS